MGRSNMTNRGNQNVAIPVDTHREMKRFADARQMKLRGVVSDVWEVFKGLGDEKQSAELERIARRRRERQAATA
jgi:hypothetical protein